MLTSSLYDLPESDEVPTISISFLSDSEEDSRSPKLICSGSLRRDKTPVLDEKNPNTPLIKALKQYYQRYATVQLPVFEIKQLIKDCYIHLALVTHQLWSGHESNVQLQAFAQLYGYETAQTTGRLRNYEDLFKKDALIDMEPCNLFKKHQRVIVVGRAGIGVTHHPI